MRCSRSIDATPSSFALQTYIQPPNIYHIFRFRNNLIFLPVGLSRHRAYLTEIREVLSVNFTEWLHFTKVSFRGQRQKVKIA